MKSFGICEALILGGSFLVSTGRVVEGFSMIGIGTFSGFARFSVWFGLKNSEKNQ